MEIYNEIHVFMSANTTSFLKPTHGSVMSTFKSYYVTNAFYKAIAAIDSDFPDESSQS